MFVHIKQIIMIFYNYYFKLIVFVVDKKDFFSEALGALDDINIIQDDYDGNFFNK